MNTAVGIIIGVLIILGVIGLWHKYLPDRPCWWCKGSGKRWGSTRGRSGRSGPCFFCGGSGKRKKRGEKR